MTNDNMQQHKNKSIFINITIITDEYVRSDRINKKINIKIMMDKMKIANSF